MAVGSTWQELTGRRSSLLPQAEELRTVRCEHGDMVRSAVRGHGVGHARPGQRRIQNGFRFEDIAGSGRWPAHDDGCAGTADRQPRRRVAANWSENVKA